MEAKPLVMVAAACAAVFAVPGHAQALHAPTTMFFMELPLDAASPKAQAPNFGVQLRGSRPRETLRLDQRTWRRRSLLPALGGIEATWVVAGVLGVAAVASIARKDPDTSRQLDAEKQAQREACPVQCVPK